MSIDGFKDLRVWQVGMDLVEQVYRVTQAFPAHEVYGLSNQMRRASVSIPSSIAEGHTREYTKEYLYYLSVAQASLAEVQTQIEIAQRLHYVTQEQFQAVLTQSTSLAKQLYALRNALKKGGK
ncbi:MAG: four helix bundle protein [Leptolyngbyaceae cyanobacterium bins.302]|nr:four helix bundle protein [Leptolyngbyaceae cyanobacterium bins.302]